MILKELNNYEKMISTNIIYVIVEVMNVNIVTKFDIDLIILTMKGTLY